MAKDVLNRARRLMADYGSVHGTDQVKSQKSPMIPSPWKPPDPGVIKINEDAAVRAAQGIGVVARDSLGCVVKVAALKVPGVFSHLIAECLAAREGA